MIDRRQHPQRRLEERIGLRVLAMLKLGSKIVAAGAAFFAAVVAATISAKSAWTEVIKAFFPK